MTVKAPGVEVSLEKVTTAAAALGAAGLKDPGVTTSDDVVHTVRVAAKLASGIRFDRASLLWVDDHPENNQYEVMALSAFSIRITSVQSTADALIELTEHEFPLVITDLARKTAREDDPNAGITLLNEISRRGLGTPCIVYAGAQAIRERESILAAGAMSVTNSPTELLSTVLNVLLGTG